MTAVRLSGMLEGTEVAQKYIDLDAQRDSFQFVSSASISACSGKAFSVDKGQVFRILQTEGPQIEDLWFLNRDVTSEHFMGHATFLHEGAYPRQFSQFWSCMPQVRPMATMLLELSGRPKLPENFHNHVVLGGHCTSKQWEMLSGVKDQNSCHGNAIAAIAPFGLAEPEKITTRSLGFETYETNTNNH